MPRQLTDEERVWFAEWRVEIGQRSRAIQMLSEGCSAKARSAQLMYAGEMAEFSRVVEETGLLVRLVTNRFGSAIVISENLNRPHLLAIPEDVIVYASAYRSRESVATTMDKWKKYFSNEMKTA